VSKDRPGDTFFEEERAAVPVLYFVTGIRMTRKSYA
jgi:hypothetical protein